MTYQQKKIHKKNIRSQEHGKNDEISLFSLVSLITNTSKKKTDYKLKKKYDKIPRYFFNFFFFTVLVTAIYNIYMKNDPCFEIQWRKNDYKNMKKKKLNRMSYIIFFFEKYFHYISPYL